MGLCWDHNGAVPRGSQVETTYNLSLDIKIHWSKSYLDFYYGMQTWQMWQLIGLFQSIGWWKAHRRDGNFSLNGSVIKISKIRHIIWQEKYEQNLPSNWKNKIHMSKTCHQFAIKAHIWAQLVIKISIKDIYGSNLPSNWHNITYMSIFSDLKASPFIRNYN